MIPVGTITVGPNSGEIAVGSFSLGAGHDTLWVEVQRTSPDQGWPWSYGILSWRSSFGNELGAVKAYANPFGEIYKLSVSRAPRTTNGTIYYEPRAFNLGWIKKGYSLSLAFTAVSGVQAAAAGSPVGTNVAFAVGDASWRYNSVNGLVNLEIES